MRLLDLLFRRDARRQLASVVAEVARLSLPAAIAALGERLSQMGLAEGRGYIRARVRLAVEDQAAALLSVGSLNGRRELQAVVCGRALDRVVARLVAEQATRRTTPAILSRRAA